MKEYTGKRKAIRDTVLFSVLVLGLAFLSPLLGGSPPNMGPGFIVWGAVPLLVAVLLRTVGRDWADSGIRLAFRENVRWYLGAILVFPVITTLAFLLGETLSVSAFSNFSLTSFLKTFLAAVPVFIVFALFEEFGWRGYLVPKLASLEINSFAAYAFVSLVWATWHLPYFRELAWVYGSEPLITFIPRFYLAMFAFSILFGEIRLVTGSVWPAILMHGIMNAFGHPMIADSIQIVPGMDYLVSPTGLLVIVPAGLIGIALNRYRTRREKRATASSHR